MHSPSGGPDPRAGCETRAGRAVPRRVAEWRKAAVPETREGGGSVRL